MTGGFNGGFDGDGGLGRDGGLGLGGATKKRSRGPPGHSTLCVGFAASGCLAGVEVVVAAGFFASRRVAWGRWGGQLEHRGGLGQRAEGGLGLAVPKSEPKVSRGFALAGTASSSAAAGFSFCCTTSALSQPSRVALRHSTN